MSGETYQWLAENVLAGFVDARPPWWLQYAKSEGFEPNTWPGAVPMDEVIKLIASWEPIPESLYTADMQLVPSHKAYRASDTNEILSVVGVDSALHSYRDWLSGTVTETVGDEAQVSSAGLLNNRAQAWVQIERPESAVGPDGILFSPYVVLSTSIDGTLASQINQNTQMVICDNTLAIGRTQGLASRIKHTRNSAGRLADHRGVMMAIMQGESDFRAELERQLAVEVPDNKFQAFLASFAPINDDDIPAKKTRSTRVRREITTLYNEDPRVAGYRGTEFGVVQAVNTWNQHMSQLRNTTGYEMDDTNLRAMRNYANRLRGNDGADMNTVKVLEGVL
jgi:phage/plasmid-like protein (TIGR03299 family)